MNKIRMAKALIRLARRLVAYGTVTRPGELVQAYFVGGTYTNVTGDFKHPKVHGYWAEVENASFTITETGLDWNGGTWKKGTWHDGIWRGGTWKFGKWLGGTWKNGVWISGYDRDNKKHGRGDSPDKWNGDRGAKRSLPGNGTQNGAGTHAQALKDIWGDDYEPADQREDDMKLYEMIFGKRPGGMDITPGNLFGDGKSKSTGGKYKDITPDDLFGDKRPKSVQVRKNTETWILTKCSDNRTWEWEVPVGLKESDIMERFECAMKEYGQRMRGTWDIFMDSADKYSVRDEDDNEMYTFTKSK